MNKNIVLILPVIFFSVYWILSFFKSILHNRFIFKYIQYDKRMFKRAYYLFILIWAISVIYLFNNEINNLKIIDVSKKDNSQLPNYLYVIFGIVVFAFIWDFLFISCRNISSFVFKDIKITADEITEIKIKEDINEKNTNLLHSIINVQNKMICDMSGYIINYKNDESMDEDFLYRDIIKKYAHLRKSVDINIYNNDTLDYEKIKKDCKLDDAQLSGIKYALVSSKLCIPSNLDTDIIYAIISTEFCGEYIIILKSELLHKHECMIIQNLITILDVYLENVYLEGQNSILEEIVSNK